MSQLSPTLLRVLAMLAAQEEATASGQPQAAQAELDALADADDSEVAQILQGLPQGAGEGEEASGPQDRVTTPTLIKLEEEGAAFATKPSDWKPYKGPQGAQGWENVHTGRVEYVPDRPGGEAKTEITPPPAKSPPAPPGPPPGDGGRPASAGERGAGTRPAPRPSDERGGGTRPGEQPVASPSEPEAPQPAHDSQALRQSLSQTRLRQSQRLTGSANEVHRLTLEDGTRAAYKPKRGETPLRRSVEAGTYYRREVAASQVADVLGMSDLVPATVFRRELGGFGSAQHWVDDADTAFFAPAGSEYDGPEDAARAALFDYVTGQMDRHYGNWLLDQQGKIHLSDNGLSFPRAYFPGTREAEKVFFRKHAVEAGLTVPDLGQAAGRWGEVEQALRTAGIEEEAINLTRERFELALQYAGRPFAELPDLMDSYGLKNVNRLEKTRPSDADQPDGGEGGQGGRPRDTGGSGRAGGGRA